MIYLTQIYVIRVCSLFDWFELGAHGREPMKRAVMGMTQAINEWQKTKVP